MSDVDLIYRCLGIILESIAFSGGEIPAHQSENPTPNILESKEE